MIIRITSKRQVTFPKKVMDSLRLREGDALEIAETPDGFILRPHRFSRDTLAPLRGKFSADLPPPELEAIRHVANDSRLRD